ncbi:MAG: hypothetical protein K0R17_3851, partial [Rariglobus sp.]|nr:hypothetical protein [Rariglobus sp.]
MSRILRRPSLPLSEITGIEGASYPTAPQPEKARHMPQKTYNQIPTVSGSRRSSHPTYSQPVSARRKTPTTVLGVATLLVLLPGLSGETIGGGTVANPAVGPAPAHAIGGTGFTLVRNWNFGTSESSTVKSYSELNTHFNYHNMNGVTGPQIGYGAEAVAPSYATAVAGQPIENVNTAGPVREFFTDSLRTYVLPLDGATTVSPSAHNAGSGSFFAKWSLPAGGSVLGQDILWETRVRYVPPKQFWFSIWTAGKQWAAGGGPEIDLIESFDYEWNGTSANPN